MRIASRAAVAWRSRVCAQAPITPRRAGAISLAALAVLSVSMRAMASPVRGMRQSDGALVVANPAASSSRSAAAGAAVPSAGPKP